MAQKPPTDLTGQVIAGRYELLEVIARGGQGLVWRAKDQREGGEVAVKTLDEAAARDPQLVERFRREQRALVALEGTSAVRVFDMAPASNGALCLVMELLDGTDLESHLEELEARSERMMTERLFEILAPVVDTLEKAHAAGIFHRDLKPANIFLLKGGGVRLLDFGFARIRAARALTAVGTVMGSPAYIAPEVWKGRPDRIDHRVDIYSLAVVIFRVLAGRPPFETESLPEMLKLATSATRPSLLTFRPALPPDIDAWVKQALAVEPDERFRSVRALWNSLHDILLPGQPLTSSEPEPRPEPKPARARPRGLAAALRKAADKAADVVRRLAGSEEAPTDQSGATSGEPSAEPAAKPKTDLATPSSAHEETTSSGLKERTTPTGPLPKLNPPPRPLPRIPAPPRPIASAREPTAVTPSPFRPAARPVSRPPAEKPVSDEAVTLLRIPPVAPSPAPQGPAVAKPPIAKPPAANPPAARPPVAPPPEASRLPAIPMTPRREPVRQAPDLPPESGWNAETSPTLLKMPPIPRLKEAPGKVAETPPVVVPEAQAAPPLRKTRADAPKAAASSRSKSKPMKRSGKKGKRASRSKKKK